MALYLKMISTALLLGVLSPLSFAAPDRETFAKQDRPIESVPVDAFELSDPNLKIEVWAQSPLIYSPVSMDCDAKGRFWVTEGIDYNQKRRVDTGQSIIVVEDTDNDGVADSSHVFVTEKNLRHAPLGIAVFDNQIVLSATPSIIVYTDVNRDAVFDATIDKREVFLTGFKNNKHDHTLHAVVGAPSGQWHFSFGNCGADIKTKDGKHFISGCYYGNPEAIGKPSSDGHLYTGGLTMRINPDGTGLAATAHNMRNPHDMFVTSFGDIFQSDNDDPAHCRASWVMEFGNMGYADMKDGSRSWEEVAKTWEEPSGWSKSLRYSRSHWRENYPGACPPGHIYGAGSPTGNTYIEDNILGLKGTYLHCCMVRKEVLAYRPQTKGAGFEMNPQKPLVKLKDSEKKQHFLPTDLAIGTDGSLYLSDFYNDTSRRTNQVSGTIYRITHKDQPHPEAPPMDFDSITSNTKNLHSYHPNSRSHAALQLIQEGALEPTKEFLKKHSTDLKLQARALWVLAQLDESGQAVVTPYLTHSDPNLAITAFRALKLANPEKALSHANLMALKHPAIRREISLALRDASFDESKDILKKLISRHETNDRYSLEALGVAFTNKEPQVYNQLVKPTIDTWNRKALELAWRLHTPEAIDDLEAFLKNNPSSIDDFRFIAMAFASYRNQTDRDTRKVKLTELGKLPAYADEAFQATINEIIAKDLNDLEGELLKTSYPIPKQFGIPSKTSNVATIAKLKGNAESGQAQSARCLMCHKIGSLGVGFGPNLTNWGQTRTIDQIINEIIHPDVHLAHGYDQPVRLTTKAGHIAEGIQSNYSWHAGSLKMKVMGGVTKKILFRQSGAKIENLKESWMPSAAELGMTDQNVRDVAEYLHTLGNDQSETIVLERGNGPDWLPLDGKDFVNVNCYTDTWKWQGGHVYCTGRPTGVIRTREPLENFEFVCEWMHKKKGGNAGIFVWAQPNSLLRLTQGQGRLPQGIEVQVLDIGYREVYEKQFKKPGDWFTSHGDVFTVGPIKMEPFPPKGPRGKRSFPSENRSLGIYQWNHYHVKAIDGVVRLSVNGKEVSGGSNISPATGYLCLESEGAPIEFRNLRLKKLSPSPKVTLELPIPEIKGSQKRRPQPVKSNLSLKGHTLLGIWQYQGHTREFTEDGQCILRNGERVIWIKPATSKTENSILVEGTYNHLLKGDTLHIEGKYQATRPSD